MTDRGLPTRRDPILVRRLIGVVLVSAALLSACGGDQTTASSTTTAASDRGSNDTDDEMDDEMDGDMSSGLAFPEVGGYYQGEEILFVHTAASDPDIATTLQDMMGSSPVIYVEALADVPPASAAAVYVFTNGIEPEGMDAMGPFGFQPDVFDSVPGDENYSPLRRVTTVTWTDPTDSITLTDVSAIESAATDGQITLEQTGIVVNMPLLRWPDGQR